MSWPDGMRIRPIVLWPGERTRPALVRSSNFKASWSSTLNLLNRELDQLKARNIVLQVAIREQDFRLDGYPRAQAKAEHAGAILTLDSSYGPLSYPCDTFDNWQDNIRAIALALEALRAVDRYGVTKRGEQYTGWKQIGSGATPAESMTAEQAAEFIAENTDQWGGGHVNAYELLHGDAAVLTKAYRVAARRLHPDTGGGTADAAKFQRLQEAKRVLDGAR